MNQQQTESRLDIKGLTWFLCLTFGLTIVIASVIGAMGKRVTGQNPIVAQFSIMGAMFVPGLVSIFVRKVITKEGFQDAGLRWGSFREYAKVWGLTIALFVAIFGLTWLAGYAPDFSLRSFTEPLGLTLPISASLFSALIFAFTIFLSPVFNFVPSLGEELGWRGYLLPKLMPLGTTRALLLHGVIWGLWHVPFVLLVGFGGYPNRWLGAILYIALIAAVGVYFGHLRLKTGSTLLPTYAHAMFNAQGYGLWVMVWVSFNRYIGGVGGAVGIAVLGVLGWYALRQTERLALRIKN